MPSQVASLLMLDDPAGQEGLRVVRYIRRGRGRTAVVEAKDDAAWLNLLSLLDYYSDPYGFDPEIGRYCSAVRRVLARAREVAE